MKYVIPVFTLCLGLSSVIIIFVMQENELIRQVIDLYKNQPQELRSYLALDKIAADSLLGALPPIIWFWAFTVYVMRAPSEDPFFDDNCLLVKIFKSVVISPLSNLLLVICGAILGAAFIIFNDTGLIGISFLAGTFALLVGVLAYGVRFSTYFNKTKDNLLGTTIYRNKKLIAIGFFILGVAFYYYSLFAPIVEAVMQIHGFIERNEIGAINDLQISIP